MNPCSLPHPRDEDDGPRLAVRRHTDRCFFAVEEVVHEPDGAVAGYVVDGVMMAADEIAEVRAMDGPGNEACG